MALMNRFEVVNFLDGPDRQAEDWCARFRHNRFDLNCLSAAIVMTNGSGKTRLVNALMAIIARDRHLVGETRKFMAPRLPGMPPSHIRVELMVPKTPFATRQAPLLSDGYGEAGDKWVLGIYGYRNREYPVRFYYYNGTLEMTGLLAKEDADEISIISEEAFRARLRAAPSAKHDVRKDDWDAFVAHFIPPQHTKKMAEFQKQGGGDKAAEFFNITPKHGERFDQTFFYEHIAPELLADVMGSDAEQGEYYFESTLHNSSVRLLDIQKDTGARKERLEKSRASLEKIYKLAELAGEIQETRTRARAARERLLSAARSLFFLAGPAEVPGIPGPVQTGDPLTDRLLPHMGIVPDQGPVLQDTGLARLLGRDAAALSRMASKLSVKAITGGPFIGRQDGPGKCYTQARVLEVIRKAAPGIFVTASREAAEQVAARLFRVFGESCDTSPFRRAIREMDRQTLTDDEKQKGLEIRYEGAGRRIAALRSALRAFESDRDEYLRMVESGLFSATEPDHPESLRQSLEASRETLHRDRTRLSEQLGVLKSYRQGWERFARKFGEHADPETVRTGLQGELKQAEEERVTLDETQAGFRERADVLKADILSRQAEIRGYQQALDRLSPYYEDALAFQEQYPDGDPEALDRQLRERESGLEAKRERLMARIGALGQQVIPLRRFREKFGDQTPRQFLDEAETRKEALGEQKRALEQEHDGLERRLADLGKHRVAPGNIARKALDAIPPGVESEQLYRVIGSQPFSDARKASLLTLFSALLFAPVAASLSDARKIIRAFREHRDEFPVPVFLRDELIEYLSSANMRIDGLKRLTSTFWVGEQTGIVACLLDPRRLETEKETILKKRRAVRAELDRTEARLRGLKDAAPEIELARRAEMAVQEDAETRLTEAEAALASVQAALAKLQTDYDDAFREAIPGAKRFYRAGGFPVYEEIAGKQTRQQADLNHLETVLEEITRQQNRTDRRIRDVSARIGEIRTAMAHADFQNALRFTEAGGSGGIEKIESQQAELDEAGRALDAKLRFDFAKAARYVRRKPEAEQQVRALEEARREHGAVEEELAALKQQMADRTARRRDYDHLSYKYDTLLSGLMAEYNRLMASCPDFGPDELNGRDETVETLARLTGRLREGCREMDSAPEALIAHLEAVERLVRGLEVRQAVRRLGELEKEADRRNDRYGQRCHQLLENRLEGFSAVEKDRIRATIDHPVSVIPVHQAMLAEIARLEQLYQQDEKDQQTLFREMIERLTGFVREAEDNLILLRRVCRKNKAVLLDVAVEIISENEIRSAIEEILADIGQHRLHHRADDPLITEREREKNSKTLMAFIRDRIYRYIFRKPAIRLTHPNIASGKKVLLSNGVSNGEESGLGLMLQTRIAEFANQRSVRAYSGSSRVRRRLQKSGEMGFMIVDGLFSSLSNEEYINNSLESLAYVQGNFQLIGFIHAQYYVNNPRIFPTLIYGNRYDALDNEKPVCWVETHNLSLAEQQGKKVGSMALFQSTILEKRGAGA
ncbi:hypothetical protein DENIS_4630 [Desulfonema ishimotonii]|uniref:Uncharacterized protein n=1 Tax=Desulfonema ishimotonii TaxID=45657 RepID=A0A401G308_9BACT|nr:hypothetical protein [Desulfonema ishimotonii]GBC63632.1 hypothetical protein DENIS_4630 [Desulfonema ishimotonii]